MVDPRDDIPDISSLTPSSSSLANPSDNEHLLPLCDVVTAGQTPPHLEHFRHCPSLFLPPSLPPALLITVRNMDHRSLLRSFHSSLPPSPRPLLLIAIFGLVLLAWPFLFVQVTSEFVRVGLTLDPHPWNIILSLFILMLLVGVLFLFARLQASLSLQWCTYASFVYMLLVLSLHPPSLSHDQALAIFGIFLLVQLSVLFFVQLVTWAAPRLALRGLWCPWSQRFQLLLSQDAPPPGFQNITFTRYNKLFCCQRQGVCSLATSITRCLFGVIHWLLTCCSQSALGDLCADTADPFTNQLRYRGAVDILGRPHGLGEWTEDKQHGEKLYGFWFRGVPIGPFTSQDRDSGSRTINTRVAFASCRGLFNAQSDGLVFGVGATECSVSGNFFSHLPITRFFNPTAVEQAFASPPFSAADFSTLLSSNYPPPASLLWCFKMVAQQLPPPAHRSISRHPSSLGQVPKDQPANEEAEQLGGCWCARTEAPLSYEARTQADTFSDDGIDWISRSSVAAHIYMFPPRTALIFIHGFNVQLEQGVAQLSHLVAFSNLPPNILPVVFTWPGDLLGRHLSFLAYHRACQRAASDPRIAVSFSQLVSSLRSQGIREVLLLTHSAGTKALFNGLAQCYEDRVFKRLADNSEDDAVRLKNVLLVNPDFPLSTFVQLEYHRLRAVCDHIVIYGDPRDQALTFSECWHGQKCLGKRIFNLREPTGGSWLDLDVVDTSLLHTNTDSIRHCYYPVSRDIVDDMRDVVVYNRRAYDRDNRLDMRRGNVFCFRVAPKHVSTLYA
eukprot:GHVS01068712.1.p1 GENE.GHVS01068712.1~~GHVS01068712.1.p1  ORF type:complete len:783 (-),score=94.81 GHVS01068712.1:1890-4238(-)